MGGAPAPFAVSPGAWDGSPDRSPGTSLLSPDMATPYKDGASRPHGMIALAGPCSSGSTRPTSDCPDVTHTIHPRRVTRQSPEAHPAGHRTRVPRSRPCVTFRGRPRGNPD